MDYTTYIEKLQPVIRIILIDNIVTSKIRFNTKGLIVHSDLPQRFIKKY